MCVSFMLGSLVIKSIFVFACSLRTKDSSSTNEHVGRGSKLMFAYFFRHKHTKTHLGTFPDTGTSTAQNFTVLTLNYRHLTFG